MEIKTLMDLLEKSDYTEDQYYDIIRVAQYKLHDNWWKETKPKYELVEKVVEPQSQSNTQIQQ